MIVVVVVVCGGGGGGGGSGCACVWWCWWCVLVLVGVVLVVRVCYLGLLGECLTHLLALLVAERSRVSPSRDLHEPKPQVGVVEGLPPAGDHGREGAGVVGGLPDVRLACGWVLGCCSPLRGGVKQVTVASCGLTLVPRDAGQSHRADSEGGDHRVVQCARVGLPRLHGSAAPVA